MIIGVHEQLEELAKRLENSGFSVTMVGTDNCEIDVFIYSSDMHKLFNIVKNSDIVGPRDINNGVLLIDVCGRTLNEVTEIIKTRVYSSLF